MRTKIRYVIAPVLFIAAFTDLWGSRAVNAFYIQSMCRDIYVPISFWVLVILYAALSHLMFFKDFHGMPAVIRKAIIFGFLLNIYSALFNLVVLLAKDSSFLSPCYLYYIKVLLCLFTFSISLVSVLLINISLEKHRQKLFYDILFSLPLLVIPIYFVMVNASFLNRYFAIVLAASYLLPYVYLKSRLPYLIIEKTKSVVTWITKKNKNFIVFIFLLSLIFRCIFAVNIVHKTESSSRGSFILASDDGGTYDRIAQEILDGKRGRGFPKIEIWGGYWDEGYGALLSIIYKFFGRNFYVVTLMQALWGSLIPVFVFLIGKDLFSRSVGIFASLALASKGSVIFFSIVLNHEAIWLPLAVLLIMIMSRAYRNNKGVYKNVLAAGIVLGIICVFRGLFIYFLAFASLWIILFWNNRNFLERLKTVAIFSLAAILLISAISLICGCPLSSGSPERFKSIWMNSHLCDQFQGIGNKRLVEIGIDPEKGIIGFLRVVIKDPMRFLKVAISIYPMRIIGFLESYQFGFFDPTYLVNSAKWPNDFMPTLEFYFTMFFMCGLVLCIRRRYTLKSPVFMIIVFNVVLSAVIFCHLQIRQRAMSIPFIYIIGSYGLVEILKYLGILKEDIQ